MADVWERTSTFLSRGTHGRDYESLTMEDTERVPMVEYKEDEGPRFESAYAHGQNSPRRWKPVWIFAGGVSTLIFLTLVYNLWSWSEVPASGLPGALDGMPIFSTSLGCVDAPFMYKNQTDVTFSIPMATPMMHAELDLRGGATGTFMITDSDAPDLQLSLTVRAEEYELAQHIKMHLPAIHENGEVPASHTILWTPNREYLDMRCMRFDAILRVPRALRTLNLHSYSHVHIVFDPSAHVALEDLSINVISREAGNIVLAHEGVAASRLTIDTQGGWISGEFQVADYATIIARGDTRSRLVVRPATVGVSDSRVGLQTVNERGRMDVVVERTTAEARTRPIRSKHDSSFMAELYLMYDNADFDGTVTLDAWQAEAHNVHGAKGTDVGRWQDLWVGTRNGPDKVEVNAGGAWVGLFF